VGTRLIAHQEGPNRSPNAKNGDSKHWRAKISCPSFRQFLAAGRTRVWRLNHRKRSPKKYSGNFKRKIKSEGRQWLNCLGTL